MLKGGTCAMSPVFLSFGLYNLQNIRIKALKEPFNHKDKKTNPIKPHLFIKRQKGKMDRSKKKKTDLCNKK